MVASSFNLSVLACFGKTATFRDRNADKSHGTIGEHTPYVLVPQFLAPHPCLCALGAVLASAWGARMQRLQAQLEETTRRLRAARKAHRRETRVPAGRWSVAKVIMALRDGEPTAAANYLQRTVRGKGEAARDGRADEELLRGWWRCATVAEKEAVLAVTDAEKQKKRAVTEGRRVLAESDLESWVRDQNIRKGISPMSSVVLERANRALGKAGVAGARTRKAGFQWLRRWRRRWGLRLRKLPPLEKPSEEEVRQKAVG